MFLFINYEDLEKSTIPSTVKAQNYNSTVLYNNCMVESEYKPKWGERHDAVVKRYEAKKRNGTAHFTTIVTRDKQLG